MSHKKFIFKHFFYISNLLSILRIILILPIIYLLKINTKGGNILLVLLFLSIIATDYFDGYFSRKFNQITELGKFLDPLADKISIAAILIALIIFRNFPIPLVVILLYRDLVIFLFGLIIVKKTNSIPSSRWWGKVNTCVFAAAGLFFILGWQRIFALFYYTSYLTIIISMISYYRYGEKIFLKKKAFIYISRILFLVLSLIIIRLLLNINFFPLKEQLNIIDSIVL